MRDIPGRTVSVNGRSVYVEETGAGQDWVVFEAGMSCGRTCWDPVLPLLADRARLVAYDRAGRALSGSATQPLSVDDMAADLVAMVEAVVPGKFVLVAHSMGGLIARRAAESLEHRLQGLLLVDPTPETAPMYDTWDRTAQKIDHNLAVAQALTHVHPLARLGARNIRGLFPKATYQTMLTEDFTPASIAQMRNENRTVLTAVRHYRDQPPQPPKCPTILLAATRPPSSKKRALRQAEGREHQRRYDRTYSRAQIDFVWVVVTHLTEAGVMDADRLYEAPFTDHAPHGPEDLFSGSDVDELVGALKAISATAGTVEGVA